MLFFFARSRVAAAGLLAAVAAVLLLLLLLPTAVVVVVVMLLLLLRASSQFLPRLGVLAVVWKPRHGTSTRAATTTRLVPHRCRQPVITAVEMS